MRRIISFLLIFTALAANARQVTPEEAQSIAAEFLNSGSASKSNRAPRQAVQVPCPAESGSEQHPYYIFNATDNAGFVIVSGDTRIKKILGYSDSGSFNHIDMPPQLKTLLESYSKAFELIPTSQSEDESWHRNEASASKEGALLETAAWGQGYPYNLMTPAVDGQHCPTGCVATAMAIVMKYHNWPTNGRRNISMSGICGDQFMEYNFETTPFDWASLPVTYDKDYSSLQAKTIAQYINAIGLTVNSAWNITETSANNTDIPGALNYFFKYSDDIRMEFIQDYANSRDEWLRLIKNEIEAKRPVIYGGTDSNTGIGHAFIIDGYRDNSVHINWGWDGVANGYYDLKALSPLNYDFSCMEWMICNIKPFKDNKDRIPSPLWNITKPLRINTSSISTGKPFSTNTTQLSMVRLPGYKGVIGLAVCNRNNDIIKVISQYDVNNPTAALMEPHFEDCIVEDEIDSGCTLKLVSKEDDSVGWNLVHSIGSLASGVPMVGNPDPNHIEWTMDDNVILQPFAFDYTTAYVNEPYKFRLYFPYEKAMLLYLDDKVVTPSDFASDYCPFPQIKYYFSNAIGYTFDFQDDFGRSFEFKTELVDKSQCNYSFTIDEHITIEKYLKEHKIDSHKIVNLKISGEISYADLEFIASNCSLLENLNLGEVSLRGVAELQSDLFKTHINLKSVVLPSNIITIHDYAFQWCENLKEVQLPSTINKIEPDAFYQTPVYHVSCAAKVPPVGLFEMIKNSQCFFATPIQNGTFTTVYVPKDYINSYISQNNLGECNITVVESDLPIVNNVFIESGIRLQNFGKEIYVQGFSCMTFDGLNNNVLSLEDDAVICYKRCDNPNVSIPSHYNGYPIKYIGLEAFSDLKNLKSVVIPEGIVEIGQNAFSATALEKIVIPESVNRIGRGAFYCGWNNEGFDKLRKVYAKNPTPCELEDDDVFTSDTYNLATLYVPIGCKDKYTSAPVWRNFNNIVEYDYSGLQSIDNEIPSFSINGRTIFFENVADKNCQVFSLRGDVLFNSKTSASTKEYTVGVPGFYIIAIDNTRYKVII